MTKTRQRNEETKEKKIPKTENEVEITFLIEHIFIKWLELSNLWRSEESGALFAFEIRQGQAQNLCLWSLAPGRRKQRQHCQHNAEIGH